jgi:hypothetical protein
MTIVKQIRKKDSRKEPREVPSKNPYEFFRTPSWCVRRLIEAYPLPAGRYLEPAVGDGAIVKAINAGLEGITWTTNDLIQYPGFPLDLQNDFCNFPDLDAFIQSAGKFTCIITNPPYTLAERFVLYSMMRANLIIMLLRLQWLSSENRAPLLRQYTPDVYVLPNRPSFEGYGSDPKTDYGWFIWGGRPENEPATIHILNSTPLHERKAA